MRPFILTILFTAAAFGQCGTSGALIWNPLASNGNGGWDCTGSGGGGSGTVTSVGLSGTASQITVTGASPITTSGSWALSFPTPGVSLPGLTSAVNENISDPSSLAAQSLTNPNLTGGTSWTAAGNFMLAADTAIFDTGTGSSPGSITQASATLAIAGVANRWYVFTYVISATSGTPACEISTGFAATATALTVTDGSHSTNVQAGAAPGDFVINCSGPSATTLTIDTLSLKEVIGGYLNVGGNLTAYSASVDSTLLVGTKFTINGSAGTITGAGAWTAAKIGLAYGGTNADLSGTGGASQVLKQISSGAAVTVGQLACADLSNASAACSSTSTLALLAGNNVFTANGALSSGAGPGATFNGTWITGGTTTTTKPYHLIEVTGATSGAWSTNGTGLGVNSATGFTGNLADFQLNGTSRVKIDSNGTITNPNGNVVTGGSITAGLGFITNSATVTLSGLGASSGTPDSICINTNTVTRNAALTCTVSSENVKNHLEPLPGTVQDFMSLRPLQFQYNDRPGRIRWGFGAQQVASVNPALADGWRIDGKPWSLDQNAILALTVKAAQELAARVAALEAQR